MINLLNALQFETDLVDAQEPERLDPFFVEILKGLFPFRHAALMLLDAVHRPQQVYTTYERNPWDDAYRERWYHRDVLLQYVAAAQGQRVFRGSDHISFDSLQRTEFYREFLSTQVPDAQYGLTAKFVDAYGQPRAYFFVTRQKNDGDFTGPEVALFSIVYATLYMRIDELIQAQRSSADLD
jgi:hypothetical protein